MADPLPKFAAVDTTDPEGWAQCDRCGFWYNRSSLAFQYEWAGMQLYNTGSLVCVDGNGCYDTPQEQFRTIILPPDPPPIVNARVPDFDYEEQTPMIYQFATPGMVPPWGAGPALQMCNQQGTVVFVLQYLTSS